MIEQKKKEGWEFLFLGANIDAGYEAERIGITRDRSVTYENDSKGVEINFKSVGMDIINGDKKHLHFEGNAMTEIELSQDDLEFVKQFDIVYAERWTKVERYIKQLKQPGQIWVYDFSKRLEEPSNNMILPYLDYAFFSYDKDDTYIRTFMQNAWKKGAKTIIAMLGENGSLAYDGEKFFKRDAEKVPVVNTVGAGDSYIAAFTYGISLGESIPDCMLRGKMRATEIVQQFEPY